MIGTIRTYGGQLYWVADTAMHECKDGSLSVLLVWASSCATCGDHFEFTRAAASKKFVPNRRCQKHKKPGVSVKGEAA